jgi:hypothetical protein
MTRLILFFALFAVGANLAWPDTRRPEMRVEVKRDGAVYAFSARIDTPLSACAAYRYLTDYEAAKYLPGVIESIATRLSANKVEVERIADERILFFHVRLHSTLEFTEKPFDSLAFTQLQGDSKSFRGSWEIKPNAQGSTLKFEGQWEPDTFIPLFVIDHFAQYGLADRFAAIAELAEKRKDVESAACTG